MKLNNLPATRLIVIPTLLLFAALSTLLLPLQWQQALKDIRAQQAQLLNYEASRLQDVLAEKLIKGERTELESVITQASTLPWLELALVTDPSGRVLAATRLALKNVAVDSVLPRPFYALLEQARTAPGIPFSPAPGQVAVVRSLTFPDANPEHNQTAGLLYVSFDTTALSQQATQRVLVFTGALWAGVILMLAILLFLLRRYVAGPLQWLEAQLSHPDACQPQALDNVPASREIHALARALCDAFRNTRALAERYKRLFDCSRDGLLVVDTHQNIQMVNPRLCELVGRTPESLVGQPFHVLLEGDEREPLMSALAPNNLMDDFYRETRVVTPDGQRLDVGLRAMPLTTPDGEYSGTLLILTDITQINRQKQRLEQLAFFDTLTQLPNRRLMEEYISRELVRLRRNGMQAALLVLDVDNFKAINDSLGHPVGDQLLVALARELPALLRPDDLVGRLSGDEFVILMPQTGTTLEETLREIQAFDARLRERLQKPFEIASHSTMLSCSLGATCVRDPGQTHHDLLREADTALYQAKRAGRGQLVLFTEDMHTRAKENFTLQSMIRDAIAEDAFSLVFQPQSNDQGELVGAEVLIRWEHPEQGFISPARFIPVAEDSGLISAIGEWVLRQSIAFLARNEARLPPSFKRLAVNVSALQFYQPNFAQQVHDWCTEAGVSPERIELELTESLLIENVQAAVNVMQTLRNLGFTVALDDFGTGFSSLSYLKQLPLNKLKIDRAFIRELPADKHDATLVETILAVARHFDLDAVAEGVETEDQLEFLLFNGCHTFQGFLLSRPVPESEFIALLEQERPFAPWLSVIHPLEVQAGGPAAKP